MYKQKAVFLPCLLVIVLSTLAGCDGLAGGPTQAVKDIRYRQELIGAASGESIEEMGHSLFSWHKKAYLCPKGYTYKTQTSCLYIQKRCEDESDNCEEVALKDFDKTTGKILFLRGHSIYSSGKTDKELGYEFFTQEKNYRIVFNDQLQGNYEISDNKTGLMLKSEKLSEKNDFGIDRFNLVGKRPRQDPKSARCEAPPAGFTNKFGYSKKNRLYSTPTYCLYVQTVCFMGDKRCEAPTLQEINRYNGQKRQYVGRTLWNEDLDKKMDYRFIDELGESKLQILFNPYTYSRRINGKQSKERLNDSNE